MVQAQEIMRKRVKTVTEGMSLDTAAKILANNRIGSVVVMKGQKPVGIVTVEDIVYVVAQGKNPKKVTVKEVEKRGFFTVKPTETLQAVSRKMVKKGVKRLPVIDKGKLVGIVTDKEVLVATPELIEILSEKLKARVEKVAKPDEVISGICENCEGYEDTLHDLGGKWLCESCRY